MFSRVCLDCCHDRFSFEIGKWVWVWDETFKTRGIGTKCPFALNTRRTLRGKTGREDEFCALDTWFFPACHQLLFPAFATSYKFSRACHKLHVFSRIFSRARYQLYCHHFAISRACYLVFVGVSVLLILIGSSTAFTTTMGDKFSGNCKHTHTHKSKAHLFPLKVGISSSLSHSLN